MALIIAKLLERNINMEQYHILQNYCLLFGL